MNYWQDFNKELMEISIILKKNKNKMKIQKKIQYIK